MSSVSEDSRKVIATPIPYQSRYVKKIVDPLYRFFDWLYGSEYNPLYRSGTLAVGFLLVLLITGLYLSFFYSVSRPYESLVQIDNQRWIGNWIRTLHRYATVAALIAIVFHIIQLMAQGKCWGPRTLAWLSGIALTGFFFLSVWTGYVMVWDLHAQKVVLAGAEMLTIFPVLREVAVAAFDGTTAVPPGFFFMNLFMHVALPLGMIIFLWVHTSRLSRAVWFPRKKMMIWSTLGLTLISVIIPAPLLEKADLLKTVGRIPTDIVTGFWIAWVETIGVPATWLILITGTVLLALVPWLWRLKSDQIRPISSVDIDACTGCMQCTKDCPYEAIKMTPRADGKRLIAEIIPQHCVSCGICAASCADFAIGPEGRTAIDQKDRVIAFCNELKNNDTKTQIVMIACENNPGLKKVLSDFVSDQKSIEFYPVECCGCVHSEVLEQILEVSEGCALIGCPARNCFNRDGADLLSQRIFEKRVPFLARNIDRKRLLIAPFSEAEQSRLIAALKKFRDKLVQNEHKSKDIKEIWLKVRITLSSVILLSFCAFVAQFPAGTDPDTALLRIAGTMDSSSAEKCRVPVENEIKDIPKHMRPKQICERTPISYEVSLKIDGQQAINQTVGNSKQRTDKPLFLELEKKISVGQGKVEISILSSTGKSSTCILEKDFKAGQISLAYFKRQNSELVCN